MRNMSIIPNRSDLPAHERAAFERWHGSRPVNDMRRAAADIIAKQGSFFDNNYCLICRVGLAISAGYGAAIGLLYYMGII